MHDMPLQAARTVGVSGMDVGVSVHLTHPELLSLWWRPRAQMNMDQTAYAFAMFFDIME